MAENKSCPLLLWSALVALSAGGGRVTVSLEASACQGQACDWYDAARGCCALLTLARRA